jgi:hypothetical protein
MPTATIIMTMITHSITATHTITITGISPTRTPTIRSVRAR